jgi:hypothetical protein
VDEAAGEIAGLAGVEALAGKRDGLKRGRGAPIVV